MTRIGLTQRVVVSVPHGERRDALDQQWWRLLRAADFLGVALPNVPGAAALYLDELELAGVILTGGNDVSGCGGSDEAPERDQFERQLLTACATREIPVLGVCRGMQILLVHHGGRLRRHLGHVGHAHRVTLDTSFPGASGGSRRVNSYHRFAFLKEDLPAVMEITALSEDGSVEAARHCALPQLGVMWHPERETPPHDQDLAMLRTVFGRPRTW